MKHKALLKFMCIVMAVCILNSQAMEVNAATYGTKASSGSYTYVGREGKGIYSHEISKNSYTWRMLYPKKTVTTTIYHVYGHGDDVLSYENRVTLSTTETTEWSVNGSIAESAGVDIAKLFEAGVSITVGMGYGNSYAYGGKDEKDYNNTWYSDTVTCGLLK